MTTELCIRCKKNPIEVELQSLCRNCYNYVMKKLRHPDKIKESLEKFHERRFTQDVSEILEDAETTKDPNSLGAEGILRQLKEFRDEQRRRSGDKAV